MLINKYSHKKEFIVHRFVKVQLEMHFICQYFNTLGSLLHLLVINFILHWGDTYYAQFIKFIIALELTFLQHFIIIRCQVASLFLYNTMANTRPVTQGNTTSHRIICDLMIHSIRNIQLECNLLAECVSIDHHQALYYLFISHSTDKCCELLDCQEFLFRFRKDEQKTKMQIQIASNDNSNLMDISQIPSQRIEIITSLECRR